MKYKLLVCMGVSLLFSQVAFAKKSETFTFENRKTKKTRKIKTQQKILKSSWKRSLKSGSPKKRFYPETSAPVSQNGILYVGTQGKRFYAVDVNNGKMLWEYKHDAGIASKADIGQNAIYFVDLNGRVVALSQSGDRLWMQMLRDDLQSPPLVFNNKIYVISGEKDVYCLSQASGEVLWQKKIAAFVKPMTVRGQGQLVVKNGILHVGLADGRVYGLNPSTGKVEWSKNYSPPLKTFKDIDATLVFDDNAFFVGGYFGVLHKVNLKTKNILWTTDFGTGVTPLKFSNSLIAADLRGGLHSVSLQTGSLNWSNEMTGSVLSAPVSFLDWVFVASYDGKAYVLDPNTGDVVQALSLSSGSLNQPLVVGNKIIVLNNSGNLIAYEF